MFYRAMRSFLVVLSVFSPLFAQGGWSLYWSDEFDSTALNEKTWNVQVANPGWVNNEQEAYTAGHDKPGSNISVANGHLNIFALKSATGGITSGRIYSQNKQSFQYGRMEARMRCPVTQGYWPAFWMLGTVGGWPTCGEIDIMEGKGSQPFWTSGSFHSAQGTPVQTRGYTIPTAAGNVHDSFHIYAVDWSADSIRWFVDTTCFETLTVSAHPGIPLSNHFYFILNVAVGGNFDGNYNNTTVFPESLIVDYVRVYKWDPSLGVKTPAMAEAARTGVSVTSVGAAFSVCLPFRQAYTCNLVALNGSVVRSFSGVAQSFLVPAHECPTGVYALWVRGAFGTFEDRIMLRH